MTKKLVITSIFIWFFILNLQNIYNYFLDNKVNNHYENGNYYLSYNYYSSSNKLTLVDVYNQANSLYKLNIYNDSLKKYLSLEKTNFKHKYELFYNIWNNYYRLWEKLLNNSDKLDKYNLALEYYLKAKSIKQTSNVNHNYDFVLNKIKLLKENENKQNLESNDDNKNTNTNKSDNLKNNNINNNLPKNNSSVNDTSTDNKISTWTWKTNNSWTWVSNTGTNLDTNSESSQDWLYLTDDLKNRLLEEQKRLLEEQKKYQDQILKQNTLKDKTNNIFESLLNDQIIDKSLGNEKKDW